MATTMAAEARPIPLIAGEAQTSAASLSASSAPAPAPTVNTSRLTPLRELQLLEAYRSEGADAHRALTELLAGYQRRIYSVCYRMVRSPDDAADLTQDVLLKVVEHLSTYDGRSKLSTWIIRVAMNASLSHLRRAKLRETRSLDAAAGGSESGESEKAARQPRSAVLSSREPSPVQGVEQDQQRMLVLQALDTLDPDTRALLVLRDMQDMDYQQLAEALDVPLGTIKSRLFRARAAFRDALEALGG